MKVVKKRRIMVAVDDFNHPVALVETNAVGWVYLVKDQEDGFHENINSIIPRYYGPVACNIKHLSYFNKSYFDDFEPLQHVSYCEGVPCFARHPDLMIR